MRDRLLGVVLLFATLLLPDRAPAMEFTNVPFSGKRFVVCRVNVRTERLQLFLRDDAGQLLKSFEGVDRWLRPSGRRLAFAMNAGIYQPDGSPLGLFVSEGQQVTPLNITNGYGNFYLKPNGVFLVSDTGARIAESLDYPHVQERVILATQSGPLLLRGGKIHPAFKAGSQSLFIRNGVGLSSPEVAVFAISEAPVSFYEFATLFRDVLHCADALYLDGAICSLHSIQLKRSDHKAELGPIIGITEGL